MQPINPKDAVWVSNTVDVLNEFRNINPDVTANQIVAFLAISAHPGITQRELMETVGLTDGTVSRLMAVLSSRGAQGREGLGLIEIGFSDGDYRVRRQSLSAKGKRLFNTLSSLMARK